jgi:hypothetical protein
MLKCINDSDRRSIVVSYDFLNSITVYRFTSNEWSNIITDLPVMSGVI